MEFHVNGNNLRKFAIEQGNSIFEIIEPQPGGWRDVVVLQSDFPLETRSVTFYRKGDKFDYGCGITIVLD